MEPAYPAPAASPQGPPRAVGEATASGPVSARQPAGGEAVGQRCPEDCLTLNACTPGLDAARRTVMVHIPRGADAHDTVDHVLNDARHLAARVDVVVLTVSHRLNDFGRLDLESLGRTHFDDPVNAGLHDLRPALRWARAHASRPDGDRRWVTVFASPAEAPRSPP